MWKSWLQVRKIFWWVLLLIVFLFLVALPYFKRLFPNAGNPETIIVWKGILFFFLVPLWLWGVGTLFLERTEFTSKIFAFIAGSDNRLSLSRLQAFAWTLVIFGTWVAAMGIHTKIIPVTQAQAEEFKKEAEIAKSQSDALKINWDNANAAYNTAAQTRDEAAKKFREADAKAKVLASIDPNSDAAKTALSAAEALRIEAATRERLLLDAENDRKSVKELYDKARLASSEIENKVNGLNWVTIPPALLALAGIAIGSGIFSSIISAVNSEDKTACLTSIVLITAEQFKAEHPDLPEPSSDNLLRIRGRDLDKTGKVRLGKGSFFTIYAPILFWKSDGTEIVADVPANVEYDTIVVDTPNGKLTHKLNVSFLKEGLDQSNLPARREEGKKLSVFETDKKAKEAQLAEAKAAQSKLSDNDTEEKKKSVEQAVRDAEAALKTAEDILAAEKAVVEKLPRRELLGEFKHYYEFSDLFRDDKNPNNMDLMKFQMFGWTIVAIVVYSVLFLNDLHPNISSLPLVPSSIVILTGLSQAGYLAGKGVSNIPANERRET